MISQTRNENHFEFRGLSTDQKPMQYIDNGSVFLEMDTWKVFMFDAQNNIWREMTCDNLDEE